MGYRVLHSRAFYMVTSILMAIVFWLYVDIAQPSEAEVPIRNIPVTFIGSETLEEEGLLILGDSPTIDIRVSGPRSVITRLNQSNITVTANTGEITEAGVFSLDLNVNLPSSVTSTTTQTVRTVYRSATAVDVTVVKMVSKTVDIVPEFTGSVAENRFYDENSFALQQRKLVIQGEESEVESVSYARVELDEQELSSTWTGWLGIVLCDKEGNPVETENITMETNSISVAFYVDCQKELPLTVTFLSGGGATSANVDYSVSPKTVTVTGQEIQLDDLTEINLGSVDLSKVITTGIYDFDIVLPSGVSSKNPEQTTAHVDVSIHGLETRRITVSNILLKNAPEGHVYQPRSFEVRVRGKADAFDLLMSDDIQVTADLSGVDVVDGTSVTVPAELELEGISELGLLGNYNVEVAVLPQNDTPAEENTPDGNG